MRHALFLLTAVLLVDSAFGNEPRWSSPDSSDWASWRGPRRDGSAHPDQNPPLEWDEETNILWKTPIPGRGHGSAIVVGDKVVLAAADSRNTRQLLICLDRQTGQVTWSCKVHEGGFPDPDKKRSGGNDKSSLASGTPAFDGDKFYISFFNDGAIYTTAVDASGTNVWQRKISDYVIHQGYGASPFLHKDLVIVAADNKGGGLVKGLSRESGETVWEHKRPATPNYSSPVVHHLHGKDQLILTGCDLVTSLNPASGETLWEIEGATTECVTTTVTDGVHVYSSGGYPKNHIAAIVADGSGKIAWENNVRTYVPSMLMKDEHLYAVMDAGIAVCFDAATGAEKWKGRLGGTFSSSPVLVGDHIFASNEEGKTFIYKAQSERFEKLSTNQLGESIFATPTVVDGRIFARQPTQYDSDVELIPWSPDKRWHPFDMPNGVFAKPTANVALHP